MMPLLLTPDEIRDLTGYTQQARQLEELRRQGFYRARRQAITGAVVLERAHYEAVCASEATKGKARPEPQLRPA